MAKGNLTIKIAVNSRPMQRSLMIIGVVLWLEKKPLPHFAKRWIVRLAHWLSHHLFVVYRIDGGKKQRLYYPLEIVRKEQEPC